MSPCIFLRTTAQEEKNIMARKALVPAAFVAAAAGLLPSSASAAPAAGSCAKIHMTSATSVLHHPTVTLIFWGSQWSSNNPTMGAILAQVQDMLSGPYFSPFNQYYGIRAPRLVAQAAWYTGTSPSSKQPFPETKDPSSGPSVVEAIQGAIDAGLVPPPNNNVDNFYLLIAPNGMKSNNTAGFSGRHSQYPASNGVTIPFAWITDAKSSYMEILSHELLEGITQPWGNGTGINTDCGGSENELADICNSSRTQHGYVLSGYWSAADVVTDIFGNTYGCVVPQNYQTIYGWNGSNFQSISQAAQKVFPGYINGTPVTVATDTSDNVYLALGFPPTWYPIGGPGGAMYAVGNDSIYALSIDGTKVSRWAGGTSWPSIGLPNNAPVTGIYGGAYPAATDMRGRVWAWSQSANRWNLVADVGNAASQVVENGTSLNLVSWNYNGISQYKGSGLTTMLLGYNELTGGGASNGLIAAANYLPYSQLQLNSGLQFYLEAPPVFTVQSNFSNIDSYAVGASNLYAFSGDHQTVAQCNDPNNSNAGWTNLNRNVPLTRVYGQTGTLLGTGPVVFMN
jgi:hypothetical protein